MNYFCTGTPDNMVKYAVFPGSDKTVFMRFSLNVDIFSIGLFISDTKWSLSPCESNKCMSCFLYESLQPPAVTWKTQTFFKAYERSSLAVTFKV